MRKKLQSHLRTSILIILLFWSVFAVIRTGYNLLKIYSEEKSWFFLSDEAARLRIFGSLYDYILFINTNTPKNSSTVSFYINDNRAHYFGKYFLYPKIFASYMTTKEFYAALQNNNVHYAAIGFENQKINANLEKGVIGLGYTKIKVLDTKDHHYMIFIKK